MEHTFRHHEAFLRCEIDRSFFQVDDEPTLEDEEKLVVVIVFVPVILALHHANANHRLVDLAERLVVPEMSIRGDRDGTSDQPET